jgi:hypothetical protein
MDEQLLFTILKELAIIGPEVRMDDGGFYTKNLAESLTAVKVQTYDQVYTDLKARTLIPVDNTVNTGADKVKYKVWDTFGMAQLITNYSDDLPLVSALCQEFETTIEGFGTSYQYSIQDIRRAAMSGEPLSARDALGCRRAWEQTVESVAISGETGTQLTGIANNVNVTLYSPTTGTWSTATALEIAQDIIDFISAIVVTTDETFIPDTLLLDLASYNRMMIKPTTTTGDTAMSAYQFFQSMSPWSVTISNWNRLRNVDAAGTGPRAIAYPRNPMVLELVIPQEYEEFPPERRSLAFVVPTHGRCGGVVMHYPLAVGYMDGI